MPSEFNQHAAWPTDEDVPSVEGATSEQVTAARLAAITAFKRAVRHVVFIAGVDNDGLPSTDYYKAVQGYCRFDRGYVSISGVRTGVTWTQGALNAGSGVLVYEPGDYEAGREPDSAGPITWIEFGNRVGGTGRSIAVTGVEGAYDYCPDDVWAAVIDETVARIAAAQSAAVVGSGTKSYSVGRGDEAREVFDPLRATAAGTNGFLSDAMRAVAERYKRR